MSSQNLLRAALLVSSSIALPVVSNAGSIDLDFGIGAPPPLPVYEQPACPSPGFMWTPGYWAFDAVADGYFWVSGTWVEAPAFGLLWTPGYWEEGSVGYVWHEGYWANDVGFYGGVDYGFGYSGNGFFGGYWSGRDFFYNRTVVNVTNLNVRYVYNMNVFDNYRGQHVSFNGPHGIHAHPGMRDLRAEHETHRGATEPQRRNAEDARSKTALSASANRSHSAESATLRREERTGSFKPESHATFAPVVRARRDDGRRENEVRAAYTAPAARFAGRPATYSSVSQQPRVSGSQTLPARIVRSSAPPQIVNHPAAPTHVGSGEPRRKGQPV